MRRVAAVPPSYASDQAIWLLRVGRIMFTIAS